ncbi:MAG: Coenzyme F420 hydrogenase/dehydrogenase, beta subunit C-terminal domain [Anaerolineae bacterium]|nr:Coenzyme F420 hydrogenase/dehydrogenase, beta subunit C-terminal domain [Anaerolineae bacterium]
MANPPVIEYVVKQGDGYCSGCGVCVGVCPTQAIRMDWNELGMLEPVQGHGECTSCYRCSAVCPFADGLVPNQINPNEDELARTLFDGVRGHHDTALGFYQECLVGYAPATRMAGSSGGMGTWLSLRLLKWGVADKVISVAATGGDIPPFFRYTVSSTPEEVMSCAKSRYYPVQVADAFQRVRQERGRYAIIALPCVLKAIRLAQRLDDTLRENIVFCIGSFCGGQKTAHYLEYLAARSGISHDDCISADFRVKNEGRPATCYSFTCTHRATPATERKLDMCSIGDMWGTGLFKPNACEYCDDITAELSDVSLGDAWLPEYVGDWRGTSLMIVRSDVARQLVSAGRSQGDIELEPISPSQIVKSQAGNYRHRRKGLAYRLYFAVREHRAVPRKRIQRLHIIVNPLKARLYEERAQVQRLSHTAWLRQRDVMGIDLFEKDMALPLRTLKTWTRLASFPQLILPALRKRLARLWPRK